MNPMNLFGGFEIFGLLLILLAIFALWSTVKVVPQDERGEQRPDMQTVRRRIEPAVQRAAAGSEPGGKMIGRGGLVNESSPGEFGEDVHVRESGVRGQGSGVGGQGFIQADLRKWD